LKCINPHAALSVLAAHAASVPPAAAATCNSQPATRARRRLFVLEAVRERVRCKEVWVSGADRYRNPDDDLPADFAVRRDAYYQELGQPLEADAFIDSLQQEMTDALAMLDRGLPTKPDVRLVLRSNGKNASRRCPIRQTSSVSSWSSVVAGQRPVAQCSRKSTCVSDSLSSFSLRGRGSTSTD
jgi:hypothetical protein